MTVAGDWGASAAKQHEKGQHARAKPGVSKCGKAGAPQTQQN